MSLSSQTKNFTGSSQPITLPAGVVPGSTVTIYAAGGAASSYYGSRNGALMTITGVLQTVFPITVTIGANSTGVNGATGFSGGGGSGGGAVSGGAGSTAVFTTGNVLIAEVGGADGISFYDSPTGSTFPAGSGGGSSSESPPTPASGSSTSGAGSGGAAGGNGGSGESGGAPGGVNYGGLAIGLTAVNGVANSGLNSGAGVAGSLGGITPGNVGSSACVTSIQTPAPTFSIGYSAYGFGYVTAVYHLVDAPGAPVITSPAFGAPVDAHGEGITFAGTYNAPSSDTGPLLRVQLDVSGLGYWTGSGWSGSPATVAPTTGTGVGNGGAFTLVIPATEIPDGTTYGFTLWCVEEFNSTLGAPATSEFQAVNPPTCIITAPLGTVTSLTPTVSWTHTIPSPATNQQSYRYVVYSSQLASGIVPSTTVPDPNAVYDSGIVGTSGTPFTGLSFNFPGTSPALNDGLISNSESYYGYLQIQENGPVASAWVEGTFTVTLGGLATPVLTAVAGTDPVSGMPAPSLSMVAVENLLGYYASSYEGVGLGNYPSLEVAGWNSNSPAVSIINTWSASGTWPAAGSQSLELTSTGSVGNGVWLDGFEFVPCVPGQTMQFMVVVQQPSLTQSFTLQAQFVNSSFGDVGSAVNIATGSGSSAGTVLTGTHTVPAGAAYVFMELQWTINGASQVTNVDAWGIYPVPTAAWTVGGAAPVTFSFAYSGEATTTYGSEYQYSLDGINFSDVMGGLAFASSTQTGMVSSMYDLGAPFNSPLWYQVRNTMVVNGQTYYSAWSNVVSLPNGVSSTHWWVVAPTDLSLAMQLYRLPSSGTGSAVDIATPTTPATPNGMVASVITDEWEQLGIFRTFGKATATMVHGDIWNDEFDLDLYFLTTTAWNNFKSIRNLQQVVLLKSDMEGTLYWVTLGPDLNPGIISRADRQVNPTRGLTVHCTPTDPYVA